MTNKITVELSEEYAEHLKLLKQVVPSSNGEEITDDGKMVEALIDSFMSFIQEQAAAHQHSEWGWCCGGGWHNHWESQWEKKEWGCCSKK